MLREVMKYPHYGKDMPCASCRVAIPEYVDPCNYCGKHYCHKHLSSCSPTICKECHKKLRDDPAMKPILFTEHGRIIKDMI